MFILLVKRIVNLVINIKELHVRFHLKTELMTLARHFTKKVFSSAEWQIVVL